MSWVCEICSSNNEDGSDTCFVCGCERSEESKRLAKELLLAEKKRIRKEKIAAVAEKTFKVAYKTLIILFAVALTLSVAMFVALIVKLTLSKNLSWIESNAGYFLNKLADMFAAIFQSQVWQLMGEKLAAKFGAIWESIKGVFTHFKNKMADFFESCVQLGKYIIQKFIDIKDNVVSVYKQFSSKIIMLIESFNSIWALFASKF